MWVFLPHRTKRQGKTPRQSISYLVGEPEAGVRELADADGETREVPDDHEGEEEGEQALVHQLGGGALFVCDVRLCGWWMDGLMDGSTLSWHPIQ